MDAFEWSHLFNLNSMLEKKIINDGFLYDSRDLRFDVNMVQICFIIHSAYRR